MQTLANYISGEYLSPFDNVYFENPNPATGEILARVPDSGPRDIEKAVNAAKQAFPAWSKTSITERAKILRRISTLLQERAEEFAAIESADQGKPVWLASSVDMQRALANFSFFAGGIEHYGSECVQEANIFNYTWRDPIGVVGLISPWNLPLYLLTWKLAPALAMGNTAVCKPSELTPMTAYFLTKILEEAGLPKGVCNIVFGKGDPCGSSLVTHPDVPCISFTGGTKTGLNIYSKAASMCKKVGLELGGKNAQIVFADSDFDTCIDTSIKASFLNQGEICLCSSRIFVEKSLYAKFIEAFVAKTKTLKVGDPKSKDTFLGAVISKAHLQKIMSYVELAKSEGAQVLVGGEPVSLGGEFAQGHFMAPTILTNVNPQSAVMQEEIFGPVVCVHPFESEEEVLSLANNVTYGLSASVWTRDISKAHRIAQSLHVGQVWINTWMKRDLRVPFGGSKMSGIGREGGNHSLEFFSEMKNICVQL